MVLNEYHRTMESLIFVKEFSILTNFTIPATTTSLFNLRNWSFTTDTRKILSPIDFKRDSKIACPTIRVLEVFNCGSALFDSLFKGLKDVLC